MNLSRNKDLYDMLFMQVARMHDEVDYRKHLNVYQGQRGKWKDYPSVSVGSEIGKWMAIGHHHLKSSRRDFHPLILNKLTVCLGSLNELGKNAPECLNLMGHCAENYAASGALQEKVQDGINVIEQDLDSFKFTKAFRPRTWKNIEWCANCHTMFD